MTLTRPAQFVAFDERKAVRIYKRNLPHWRQEGAAYFLTFRLADSIPTAISEGWQKDKAAWLKTYGIQYDGEYGKWRTAFEALRASDKLNFQRQFNRQAEACLDRGHGTCHLGKTVCREIVRDALQQEDGQAYHLGDFVIMPNHVHLLMTLTGQMELEAVMRLIKGRSAIGCNRALGRTGTFWQADSFDHLVRSLVQLARFREYIAANPLRGGITLPEAGLYHASWMDGWFL